MKTVKLNNGDIRTVTTRHANILIAKSEAIELIEPHIVTKEEKATTKNKGGRPKK